MLRTCGVFLLSEYTYEKVEFSIKYIKLEELKAELLRPEFQSSYSKLTEIQGQIDAMEEEIMVAMEEWEELSTQLEALLAEENALK